MKEKAGLFLAIFTFLVLLSSCFQDPEFNETPFIRYDRVYFESSANGSDTLGVVISFEDQDGDLGLNNNPGSMDFAPPYHQFDTIIFTNNSGQIDTCLKERREYYNLYVTLLRKNSFGDFEKYLPTFNNDTCGVTLGNEFYGRFPILNDNFPQEQPLSGSITYKIRLIPDNQAIDFPIFSSDTLKVRVQIADRRLRRSNVVESPTFTLESL